MSRSQQSSRLKKLFPILDWLPQYSKKDAGGDVVAGLTVAIMLVPQGMAYGLLAGLTPIYGLYASIIPLLLYALMGTSRQLSVGPVAIVSLLVLTGISDFAQPGTAEFIAMAITASLLAGLIQLALGVMRLGFLVNFLSHPVLAGFTSAAAIIIALSQVDNMLGIDAPRSNRVLEIVQGILVNLDQFHWPTFLLGAGGVVVLAVLRSIHRSIPGALIIVMAGTLLVYFLQLPNVGVAIVGEVPGGLPSFELPVFSWQYMEQLMPISLTICLISFIESLAIAKALESKHRNYKVVPNQELIALGVSKIGGAFFQSFPTTGSFSRSVINDDAGAKTGIASIITVILIAITLLFLTPLFYYLPKAILAAIIVFAVRNLIDIEEAKSLWKHDKRDFLTFMVTFSATLLFGIQIGVLTGVMLSLSIMLYRNSVPHVAVLGQYPNSSSYRNINRFEEVRQLEGILIVRFDAQLYFGNCTYFKEAVEKLVDTSESDLKLLILDASSIHDIDSSGIHTLHEVLDDLQKAGIEIYITSVIGPVRDILAKTGLIEKIGPNNFFMRIHDAVTFFQTTNDIPLHQQAATQTNVKSSTPPHNE
ncbi:MAG: solute carrier family 26 protein [Bacteroidota bacterium]